MKVRDTAGLISTSGMKFVHSLDLESIPDFSVDISDLEAITLTTTRRMAASPKLIYMVNLRTIIMICMKQLVQVKLPSRMIIFAQRD